MDGVSFEGPRFGCGFPEIYFYQTLNKGQSLILPLVLLHKVRTLTNGEEFWDVKELEVFKINYN